MSIARRGIRRTGPLNPLRAFEVAARHMSFTVAADELCVTQGAISRAVKTLEDYFGVPLFKRMGNGLELTPKSRVLAYKLTDIFTQLADATEEFQGNKASHVLTVWTYTSFMIGFLIPRLPDFQLKHPNIKVRLISATDSTEFNREQVDVRLRYGHGHWQGFDSTLLFRERYVALSRSDCPDGWRTRAGFTDAALVVAAPTATYHQGIAESLERHRLGHRIVVRARHFAAIPDLVAGGQLVAIVPEMFAQIACARLRLAMWPVPLAMPLYEVGMVWHAATDGDAAQIWLRERVLRLFRRGAAAGGRAARTARAAASAGSR